jgi:hypothetical protein
MHDLVHRKQRLDALWQDRREMKGAFIRAVRSQEAEPRPALTENGCYVIYALRSVLAAVGLGWFFGPVPVHRLPRLVDIPVAEFVALWFYGILLLGALSLGVWL